MERKAPPPVYDDPNTIINTNNSSNSVPNTQYETPTEPIPPPLPALHNPRSHTPKFDDTIYAMRQDVQLEGDEEMDSGVVRNRQGQLHTHTHTNLVSLIVQPIQVIENSYE